MQTADKLNRPVSTWQRNDRHSARTDKRGLWTTSELSVFGEVSSTRTSTLNAIKQ